MYRVIIVDDEPIICKGLRETIEWDSLGLEVSGEAGNGRQALELIRTVKPHILITDIKMPEMDGIELIEQIKQQGLNIKIIILSGYSDFVFLKKAIRLGVVSYLLKPIDNDELIANLADVVSSIEKEIVQITQLHQGQELLKSNTLNRLITRRIGVDEFKEKLAFLGMRLEGSRYLCAVCTVGKISSEAFDKDDQMALLAIHNICKELSEGMAATFIDSHGHVIFLFFWDKEVTPDGEAESVLNSVVEIVEEVLGISLLVCVGTVVSAIEEIWKSYRSALSCLDYGVFLENGGIIWCDRLEPNPVQSEVLLKLNYEAIGNLIRLGKREEFRDYMEEAFRALSSEGPVTVEYVRNLIMQLSVKIMGMFRILTTSENDDREMINYNYAALLSICRIEDFLSWFFAFCDTLFFETGELQHKSSTLVKQVIDHIERHYIEGPTLKQVACEFNVNTSYLGQIFKKETGEFYTDYVNRLRIKKASEMLLKSNLKVYEIAEEVGFTDYHYFLRIFKKMTGVTPKEIRL